ncbi:hypothetical protein WL99_22290 [Burkholderia cepacia]|uniref:DUF1376 domain-containing protein n=1 Tax=Burkholderia cepacia TaxID=292 RepID=UPI00076C7965|nr:DUF1376 domain-containing protein [Burkholderia cepacia]KWH25831.1 hypothetical protein WL99_22290 [Burkholderia cepacia]MDN7442236.1 DUF1376 domain-containing protein [Burkholderia cepacia]
MSDLPEPLTPADCDLRGHPWMALDVARVIDSDLFGLSTGDEFKTAFRLWAKSWHQVPAASLPDDDRLLAHLAGLALVKWKRVRAMALRGWIQCSDGRLYHPVIAEKALEALGVRSFREEPGKPKSRMQRLREQRDAMFETLHKNGIVRPKSTTTAELRERIAALAAGVTDPSHVTHGVTHDASRVTPPDTSPDTSLPRAYTEHDSTRNTGVTSDDVGSLIRGGAGDNSPPSSLAVDEIVALLARWETDRGKRPRFGVTDASLATWRVTAEQLRTAYDRACAERTRQHDQTAVNSGFLASFVEKVLAPPRTVVPPLRAMTDVQLEAEGRRLGVSTHGLARDQCVTKIEAARAAQRGAISNQPQEGRTYGR